MAPLRRIHKILPAMCHASDKTLVYLHIGIEQTTSGILRNRALALRAAKSLRCFRLGTQRALNDRTLNSLKLPIKLVGRGR